MPKRTGGERGIRTLGTRKRTHAFQACPFDRSGTSPKEMYFTLTHGIFKVYLWLFCKWRNLRSTLYA